MSCIKELSGWTDARSKTGNKRRGNAVYSAASSDGVSWSETTNLTVSTPSLFVGLALSSGSNSATVTADFDNVTVVGGQ